MAKHLTGQPRLVEALKKCRAFLASGPERFFTMNIGNGRRAPAGAGYADPDTIAAIEVVNDVMHGADGKWLAEDILPSRTRNDISDFLHEDVCLLRTLPARPSILRKLDVLIEDLGGQTSAKDSGSKPVSKPMKAAAVFDGTSGRLFLNGQCHSLGKSTRYVLKVLVKKRSALYSELQEGDSRPDRVLKRLLAKIPAAKKVITLPGVKGKGGYKTTIQPADSAP